MSSLPDVRWREHVKRNVILSRRARLGGGAPHPPPQQLADIAILCIFLHEYIYLFVKQEKPEMDDLKKNFGPKGKIQKLRKIFVHILLF